MRDDLLHHYEQELTFLRRTGSEFSQRYPKVASRLLLEANKCDDPHVERLLEGFAFLAARVQLRIEDDFSEFSDALLNVLYPQYTRPIPALTTAQFHLDPAQAKLSTGLPVPRETQLYSRSVGGSVCRFRTCYDTTLWPLEVTDARWVAPHALRPAIRASSAVAALRVELRCLADMRFDELEIDTLRMHLSGEDNLASTLYELLCNNVAEVLVRDPTPDAIREPLALPADAIRPVGFGENEGLLPTPRRSFLGYRLLQEYFVYPDKFFFLDLGGLDRVREAGFGDRLELVFLISPFERPDRRAMLETGVTAETLRLGCTPVVNLFPHASEPVSVTQKKHEYLVVADARRRATTGIFSIEEVVAMTPGASEPMRFDPLYSLGHRRNGDRRRAFWYATRRPVKWRPDEGTDVFLSFADLDGQLARPGSDAVTARLLAYNGDLPSRLPFGEATGDFQMQGGGPVERIVALEKPTAAIEPPLGRPVLWRLISQLSLNYVSLLEGGPETLRELLRLYNFGDSAAGERHVQGITGLRGSPCYARIQGEHGLTFARGHRVDVTFDEEEFAGGGVYLLASVLERFLSLYVSLNSFSILSAHSRQRNNVMREWPPRSGWKALL
jgi:type VI secretion system protein ImpG